MDPNHDGTHHQDLAEVLNSFSVAPVNMRKPGDDKSPGNRVANWIIELPVAEPDPVARLAAISEQTAELKESKAAEGMEILTNITEWAGDGFLSLMTRAMSSTTPMNTVITNVPGPRMPLYLLNARLRQIHPHVPLMGTMAIGIALFSYEGQLSWGFSADWDLIPDLHALVR